MSAVPPEAMAFVRGILTNPTDRLRRLVFADWLDERGGESNIAWAGYIRTQAELETEADGPRLIELQKRVSHYTAAIRTRLTLPARVVQTRFLHLTRLLPAEKVTVRLEDVEFPRSLCKFIPEAMARLYQVMPIACRKNHLALVSSRAFEQTVLSDLENFLSTALVVFHADDIEICNAIDRHDWQSDVDWHTQLDAPIEWYDTEAQEWRE